MNNNMSTQKAAEANDKWPQDVKLIVPCVQTQMLLAEHASYLAVKTYLRMYKLQYEERSCTNAEYMSPGGRLTKLPLLQVGAKQLAEFEPIAAYVEQQVQQANRLSGFMNTEERHYMRIMITHVENIFTLIELYISYMDASTYKQYTEPRNCSAHIWPLSAIQSYAKRRRAMKLLRVYQWQSMTTADALAQLSTLCRMLCVKLLEVQASGHNQTIHFMYGEQPCELDAVLFGHLVTLLCNAVPNTDFAQCVRKYDRLIAYCTHIDATYFDSKLLLSMPQL